MKDLMRDKLGAPKVVDRSTFQAELDKSPVREKAHTLIGEQWRGAVGIIFLTLRVTSKRRTFVEQTWT
jgi:hypothetical protein